MRVFISGGSKCGKSMFAQKTASQLKGDGPLYYIATMEPKDNEDLSRISRHLSERDGWGFITLEQPKNIDKCLENADINGTFLLDSITALVSNEMFGESGNVNLNAGEKVSGELENLISRVKNIVVVSDYIYGDGHIYDDYTDEFRKALAQCDRKAASLCDKVYEVVSGTAICHKGENI